MSNSLSGENKLSALQLEFLKSLKYMATEKQLEDIKSLVRYYFSRQLDTAIEKVETDKNYSATLYESWLKSNASDSKSADS